MHLAAPIRSTTIRNELASNFYRARLGFVNIPLLTASETTKQDRMIKTSFMV